ncbi:MAG: formylmethanofuran dehydrogenase subunit A [Candidatus Bathyarchaeota archaeon]|jgi:formylmethanofuran dehydrogenase subunit A|nr:formylmethanofuran dehydrogenase subunit A [Candidatus Bathyarchaeota archaeon A05DMB-3]MDH7606538.1 formylmethanofuran dehydrogenase subunit A [Candidatus Bathyarchaeota archaeon]
MELLIRNGFVYDPVNGVNGEKMDIAIKNGKIVEKVNERRAKKIDASGMVVMPGGVDIHSHIAGGKVNSGRLLRPEDHFKDFERKTVTTRSGVGYSIPSTFTTGYRYARMGWTTVMDPAMPPLEAKHTHEELSDTPIIDKASYPLLGDWWFVLEYLKNGQIEECARHVAWMITATKGYAIKLVNPGGLEAWGFGRNVNSIDDPVPNFGITPREIIRGLCKVNKLLNLPHTIHVHTNNLGKPGNYVTALETMECVEDLADGDKPVIHITHCQFCAFKGDDWRTFESGAEEIANYVNAHSHVTMDMGQVIFTDTTTMTADGPFQYILYTLSGNKWVNHDVETETSAGIVPFHYRRKSFVHATQWSIALELALLIKDPWKILMTTDHPNGGPFIAYPRIIAWLMSRKAREATLKKINPKARSRSLLPSIDRELSFYEIAIVTRAGQAKALGLKNKGHLGVGADADIAIYGFNPEEMEPSKKYKAVRRAFKRAAYTIKGGQVVVKDGEVLKHMDGATMWLDVQLCEPCEIELNEDMKRRFKEYWTVGYENYPVTEDYLAVSHPITVKADV